MTQKIENALKNIRAARLSEGEAATTEGINKEYRYLLARATYWQAYASLVDACEAAREAANEMEKKANEAAACRRAATAVAKKGGATC